MLFINNIIHLLKMNIGPQYKWVLYFHSLLEDYILELICYEHSFYREYCCRKSQIHVDLVDLICALSMRNQDMIPDLLSLFLLSLFPPLISPLRSPPLLSFTLSLPSSLLPLSPFLFLSHIYHLLCSRNHSKL